MQTKEEHAKEDERIGLLFATFNMPNPYSRQVGQKILPTLTLKELACFSQLSKMPWSSRLRGEVKRRKQGVTIYTWLGDEIPSESYRQDGSGKRARLGHSALQTYGNSLGEAGIYVSFYPGECYRNHHFTCKKSISHFHRWNEEMNEEVKKMAIVVDLYGLDIDAIHIAFHELHDNQMNSKKGWSPYYNCSDIVLLLLKKGKLFDKTDRYLLGWKESTIIALFCGILGSRIFSNWLRCTIFHSFLGHAEFPSGKRIIPRLRSSYYEEDYYNWSYANWSSGLFSLGISYLYSLFSYSKNDFPTRYYHRDCLISATKAGLLGFLIPLAEMVLVRNIPVIRKNMHSVDELANHLDILINNDLIVSLGQRLNNALIAIGQSGKNTSRIMILESLSALLVLFPPFIALVSYVSPKYIFDTTITPYYVFKIIQPFEKKLNLKNKENQNLLSTTKKEMLTEENNNFVKQIYKNRYKIGLGGLVAGIGFFAHQSLASKSPFESLSMNLTG